MTPTPSSAPITTHDAHSNISKSATIGIGVAVAVVVIILIVAAGYYLWTKHHRTQKKKETDLLPLQKYPASKNLEPQETEVVDGPRVDIWGAWIYDSFRCMYVQFWIIGKNDFLRL